MRRWTGWTLAAVGVLVAVLGVAVMVVLGPDSRFSTGPHAIETDASAVVTAPKVIAWSDVQIDVLAEVPVRKPIFVGIGNAVDVQDFVGSTQRLEITSFSRPWTIRTREVAGRPNLPGAPTAVDWWIDSSAGLGGASISTQLTDQTDSIAILSVGSSNLSGLEVTLAYGVKGGFAKGVALVLLGAGLAWAGVLVARPGAAGGDLDDDGEPWDGDTGGDDVEEEVVYVYVDDDGVEHEISAEEAAALDVEVVEEVVEVVPVAAEPHPTPVAPVPDPPASVAADEDDVVYVYVDEDGVEHEVSADELAEFELVDDPGDPDQPGDPGDIPDDRSRR